MDTIKELEKLRRQHYTCEDRWYSCPKSEDGCANELSGSECDCGADEENAILDGIVKELGEQQNICVSLKDRRAYNIELEKEIHTMEMFIIDILEENGSKIKGEVRQRLAFKYTHITRRGLASALRSLAYKIQHYEHKDIDNSMIL